MSDKHAPPPVYRVLHAAIAVAAIRIGGGALGLVAALLAGAEPRAAGIALAFGLGASTVALVSNNRWSFYDHPAVEELASAAPSREVLVEGVRRALLPSTAGVAVFLVASLPFEPILSAALAGILGGMGAVGLASLATVVVWERQRDHLLYADVSRTPRRYSARR